MFQLQLGYQTVSLLIYILYPLTNRCIKPFFENELTETPLPPMSGLLGMNYLLTTNKQNLIDMQQKNHFLSKKT